MREERRRLGGLGVAMGRRRALPGVWLETQKVNRNPSVERPFWSNPTGSRVKRGAPPIAGFRFSGGRRADLIACRSAGTGVVPASRLLLRVADRDGPRRGSVGVSGGLIAESNRILRLR